MKTAISVPDDTFRRVEDRAAALHMNRSEFFATAAEHYLRELDASSLTDEINAAVDRGDEHVTTEAATISEAGLVRLGELTADDQW